MKKTFLKTTFVVVFSFIAYYSYSNLKANNVIKDIVLNEVEAVAGGESGADHGRPLLQSTSGAYKCSNCTGNDCGAAC